MLTVAVMVSVMPIVSSETVPIFWLRSSKAPLGEVMSMPYFDGQRLGVEGDVGAATSSVYGASVRRRRRTSSWPR